MCGLRQASVTGKHFVVYNCVILSGKNVLLSRIDSILNEICLLNHKTSIFMMETHLGLHIESISGENEVECAFLV